MTSLDLGTVLILHKSSLLAGAGALLLLWFRADRPPGVMAIASGFTMLAIGAFIAGLGEVGAIPPEVWRDSSAGLAVGAYATVFLGMRRLDRAIGRWRWVLLAAPCVLGAGAITDVFADNAIRASVFHGAAALANLASGVGLIVHGRAEPLSSRLPLAAALIVCGLIYGLQIPFLVAGASTPGSIALGLSATMMLNFAIAALVVSLVRDRREEVQRRAAVTDALTGVFNRHGFRAFVPASVPRRAAMILLDLDHFKTINDRFGHACGDRVLQSFAEVMRMHLEEGDVLARLGGEEFVVFLADGGGGRADRVAQAIRRTCSLSRVAWRGEEIVVTVSLGVAIAGAQVDREDLMAHADAALYRAKGRGRNRVETAAPMEAPHRASRPGREAPGAAFAAG